MKTIYATLLAVILLTVPAISYGQDEYYLQNLEEHYAKLAREGKSEGELYRGLFVTVSSRYFPGALRFCYGIENIVRGYTNFSGQISRGEKKETEQIATKVNVDHSGPITNEKKIIAFWSTRFTLDNIDQVGFACELKKPVTIFEKQGNLSLTARSDYSLGSEFDHQLNNKLMVYTEFNF